MKLILAGNRNEFGLINCIIRATLKLRENNKLDLSFKQIHIFHTEESLQSLVTSEGKWKEELKNYNISPTSLVHHVIKIDDSVEEQFADFVGQLKEIVNPLENIEYYIDLTAGISSIKSILAVFSYVLDIEHIYTLEVEFSNDYKERKVQSRMFYSKLEKESVDINYKKFPPINKFDDFGKLNLTEIIRYKKFFGGLKTSLSKLSQNEYSLEHIESSLLTAVNSKLLGELKESNQENRQAIFSYSNAVEEITNIALQIFTKNDDFVNETLGNKLVSISNFANNNSKYFINLKVLENLTKLINSLRNEIVHPKPNTKITKEILNLQSHISHHLAVTFIQFLANSIEGFINDEGNLFDLEEVNPKSNNETIYYFGFDGDSTGSYLEDSFNDLDESKVIEKSKLIKKAINQITNKIKKETKNNKSILFAEGDNILFKCKLNMSLLKSIQVKYTEITGLNSSIGFGETLKDSTVALKIAKSRKGNIIQGIKIKVAANNA